MTRKWICILAITLIATAPAVAASPLDDAVAGIQSWVESLVDAVVGFFAGDEPVMMDPEGDEIGPVYDPNG